MPRLAATGWLVALLWLIGACSSGQEGSVPGVSSAHAERDVVDGEAGLTSTVEVHFDRSVVLAPSKVPLASNFELDIPGLGGTSKRVLVRSAEIDPGNPRLARLKVDAVVPDGATVRIAESAFKSGATGEIKVTVDAELSPTLALLASLPMAPANPALVQAAQPAEVHDSDREPAAVREALVASLQARGVDESTRRRTLDRYDSLSAAIAPSPKIRAALAALTGTFAEPAIDAIFTEKNCTGKPAARVVFQPPPDFPDLIARVTFTRAGQRVISINPLVEGERIEHLMPILAHEAIHCDDQDGLPEEIAATAFDGFLYLQLVAADPSLAAAGTVLSKELNIDAISLLNSGRRLPESVGVLPSAGVTRVLPESNIRYASFAELVAAAYPGLENNQSQQEPLAQAYVANLLPASGMPAGNAFNLRYLDELLGRAATPAMITAAIQAFALRLPG